MWPHDLEVRQSANMVTDAMAGANRIYHRGEWQSMERRAGQDQYDYDKYITERKEDVRRQQQRYEHLQSEVPRLAKIIVSARDLIFNNSVKMSQMKLELVKLEHENASLGLMHV